MDKDLLLGDRTAKEGSRARSRTTRGAFMGGAVSFTPFG